MRTSDGEAVAMELGGEAVLFYHRCLVARRRSKVVHFPLCKVVSLSSSSTPLPNHTILTTSKANNNTMFSRFAKPTPAAEAPPTSTNTTTKSEVPIAMTKNLTKDKTNESGSRPSSTAPKPLCTPTASVNVDTDRGTSCNRLHRLSPSEVSDKRSIPAPSQEDKQLKQPKPFNTTINDALSSIVESIGSTMAEFETIKVQQARMTSQVASVQAIADFWREEAMRERVAG